MKTEDVELERADMATIRATIRDGRIDLEAPANLPDGTEVLVELTPLRVGGIGMDEADCRDDPAALADWAAWLPSIEPIELTAAETSANERFEEAFSRFNVEAVRKQMSEGAGG